MSDIMNMAWKLFLTNINDVELTDSNSGDRIFSAFLLFCLFGQSRSFATVSSDKNAISLRIC